MKPALDTKVERATRLVERRLIEDVWKIERNLLHPSVRQIPVVISEEADTGFDKELANLYAGETLDKLNMSDIDDEYVAEEGLSRQKFLTIVFVLTVLAVAIPFLITFIDIKSLPDDIIKRLY